MLGSLIRRTLPGALLAGACLASGIQSASAQSGSGGVNIARPANDQTVHDNRGNVAVRVALSRPLTSGQEVVLLLDGTPVAREASTSFSLSGVDRGTHTLAARVIDQNGNAIAVSPPITFHMWRASRLSR